MKQGHGKVLAKNSTYPYFSVNCPCQQPILTGKWFADYIQVNANTEIVLQAANWPADYQQILQTDEYTNMYSANPTWTPSAVINQQYEFYDGSISWDVNGKDAILYRTEMLTQTENSFFLPILLTKENRWWVSEDHDIVSGNSTSGVYDCYNLNTITSELILRKTQGSGFISSLILNNVDNTFKVADFATVSSLSQYSISTDYSYPTLSTNYGIDYTPINGSVEAAVQYYLSRTYRGDQEGYLFDFNKPDEYTTGLGTFKVDRFMLAGADNVPVTGKVYYFHQYNHGDNWRAVRKIGNRYYGYSLGDDKTIVEYESGSIQSAALQWDDWSASINKVTTGLIVQGTQIYETPLLSTSDGLLLHDVNGELIPIDQFRMDSYLGQTWSNYQYTVGQYTYYTTKIYDHTGQYFIIQPDEEEIIGDINYNWDYYVCFPTDYNAVTSSCTIDVYKFGYYYDNDISDYVYCSGFTAASTTILTSRVQIYEDPQPQVQWDTTISAFCYEQGGGIHNHPNYTNYYFTLSAGLNFQNEPILSTYYVYKAPAWGLMEANTNYVIIFANYVVTGSTYDTVQCWYEGQDYWGGQGTDQVPISTGYYCSFVQPGSKRYLRCLSGEDYWYALSGQKVGDQIIDVPVPLTGGDLRNPQKSIAADNPDRPPYWYYNAGGENGLWSQDRRNNYYSSIASGRYVQFYDPQLHPSYDPMHDYSWGGYKAVGIIIPIYYDTFYGNVINHYGYIDQNNIGGIASDYWWQSVNMIHDHNYTFTCPFIKLVETNYNYNTGDDNPTIANFITNTYLTETTSNSNLLFSYHYAYQFASDWGGNKPGDDVDDPDYNYTCQTQMFKKLTQQQIEDPFVVPTGQIDYDLSAVLPFMDSLYCQILTGFWIRKKSDDNEGVCGIRKNGYFNQLLSFDTEYKFGYDLTNINALDAILSNDTSICYQKVNNTFVPRQVKDYWNDIKNTFTTVGDMNISKFRSMSAIRVLSAHYNIPVQP